MKKHVAYVVVCYELAGFVGVVLFLWLDEILDLPYLFFGAAPTPANWSESLMETTLVVILAVAVIGKNLRFLKRIKHLEGILPVCSFCRRIRSDNGWVPVESYLSDNTEALFSHGLCPECAREHYGEFFREEEN